MDLIASCISLQLRHPKFPTIRWRRAVFTALVPVPETAVDEDDGFVFGQDDVGAAWHVFDVKTEAVAHFVEQ